MNLKKDRQVVDSSVNEKKVSKCKHYKEWCQIQKIPIFKKEIEYNYVTIEKGWKKSDHQQYLTISKGVLCPIFTSAPLKVIDHF